jgi:hypothetical protein
MPEPAHIIIILMYLPLAYTVTPPIPNSSLPHGSTSGVAQAVSYHPLPSKPPHCSSSAARVREFHSSSLAAGWRFPLIPLRTSLFDLESRNPFLPYQNQYWIHFANAHGHEKPQSSPRCWNEVVAHPLVGTASSVLEVCGFQSWKYD